MDCPRCKSNNHVRDGIVHGKQRHKCKDCLFRYTVERKSDVKTMETRRLALELYLEGFGFRPAGRILKISYGTVYQWIKEWNIPASLPRCRENPVEITNLGQMLTYIASKKAAARYGLLLIDLEENISILSEATVSRKED